MSRITTPRHLSFLEYIFQQTIKFFLGSGVNHIIRKILGNKRIYMQIQKETDDSILMFIGIIMLFGIVIFLVIRTS